MEWLIIFQLYFLFYLTQKLSFRLKLKKLINFLYNFLKNIFVQQYVICIISFTFGDPPKQKNLRYAC